MSLEVAMQWNAAFTESVHTFANTINTHEGGTHEEGFRAALTTLVNKYARDWGMLKEKDANLTGDDVREGLTAIVSVKLAEPQFEGQTKTKLGNTEAKTFVQKVVNEQLGEWFEQNPTEGKRHRPQGAERRRSPGWPPARPATPPAAARACSAAAACRASSPTASPPTRTSASSSSSRATPPAARPSRAATRESRRSCRSAARSSTSRRPASTGSCRTRRSRRSSPRSAPASSEDFDINRLRYHKIVLMADADVDGQHIRTLLLTLLFRFMRPVVEQGHVFLAQPPLYKIKWSGREVQPEYAYSDRERDALLEAGLARASGCPRTSDPALQGPRRDERRRAVGHDDGPGQRILLQVTLEDAAQADDVFTTLMGEDVESRRQFIQRNARDVRFLDI